MSSVERRESGVATVGVVLWAFGLAACASPVGVAAPSAVGPADTLGARTLYTYTPDSTARYLIAEPQPDLLSPNLTVEAALDSLGRRLADGYFREWRGEPTGISFETVEVVTLPTPPDSVRIAVVNMADPDSVAVRAFFQGSSGGLISSLMIEAMLMQPSLDIREQRPLLDGLVLLYNGRRFPFGQPEHAPLHYVQRPPVGRYIGSR